MIGRILGERYELIEEIGKGGMAYVYKAKCVLLNRVVAVKILRDDLDGGEEFLRRFNTEAQAAASLSHSNIVSIFDVGIDQGKHYIVMEHVDGITLKEYIAQKGKIGYKEALDIAYQICDALQAAHEKNIVHRDIKPHNILVTEDRNIKVTDFGIARSGTGNTLSTGDDILGSVHYISPEQAKGEIVDNRSDLYSLGIVLYEMLTGKVPFDADTPVAVAMMQIEQNAPDLFDDDVPLGVKQIIYKAICKNKELRYQDASELKNDILCVIEDNSFSPDNGDSYYRDFSYESEQSVEYDNTPVRTPLKILLVILSAITAIAIVALGVALYNSDFKWQNEKADSHRSDLAPSVVGMTLKQAQEFASENGFKIVVSDEISDSNSDPGTIVSQTPIQNASMGSDNTIKVVINKASDLLLEDYTGLSYKSVESKLKNLGCIVELIFEESKKPEDSVLRQSPQADTKIKNKMTVTLYVSGGINHNNEYQTVPTLTGKTYSKCIEILNSAGLTLGTVTGVDTPANDDIVVSQAIPAGSMVKGGAGVGITLKSKEKPIENNEETPNNTDKQNETKEENKDDSTKDTQAKTDASSVTNKMSAETVSSNNGGSDNKNISGDVSGNDT